MSRKNRFHSSVNQNGQPIVEEENMSEQENQQDQQEEVVIETPVEVTRQVPEQAPVVEEVKQEQQVPVQQPKVEVQKDPTIVEHTKLNKNAPTQQVKQVVEQISTDSSSQAIIDKARSSTNAYIKGLANFLDGYMSKMSPGLVAGDREGGTQQYNFHNTIVQLFNQTDYEVFRNGLLILLSYMRAHEKGVFNERYLFRFSEQWPAGADKLTNFHATLNLLKIIANKQERPVGKFISLERTYNTGYTELAKENITRFLKTA